MKKILFLFFFFSVSTIGMAQQEQMYTQFMFNKLALNPAYAGHENVWSITTIYRDQWMGLEGAPNAQNFSLNSPIIANRIGLGLNIKRQSIGITQLLTIEGIYAYKLRLGKGLLSLGLQFSGRNYRVNYLDESLYSISDINLDPSIPREIKTKQYINTGFGLYYKNQNYYFGLTLPRLIRADISFVNDGNRDLFSDEKRHLFLMSGVEFSLNRNWSLLPQLLLKFSENAPFDFDFDINFDFQKKYTLGLNYRFGGAKKDFGESLDLIFGFHINEKLYSVLAYDIGLSKLRSYHNGSIELMIQYKFIKSDHTVEHINPRFY